MALQRARYDDVWEDVDTARHVASTKRDETGLLNGGCTSRSSRVLDDEIPDGGEVVLGRADASD